jgi:hypothetical protein
LINKIYNMKKIKNKDDNIMYPINNIFINSK